MVELIVALLMFIGTHFLLSHPLRASLVRVLGANGFAIVYSLIALATFGWAVVAFRGAPVTEPWWIAGDALWALASLLMLMGSVLFVGSLIRNPAFPAPGAAKFAAGPAHGVFAITRHPMMWGFAIWALVHTLVAPNQATRILAGAVAFMALVGAAGQDRKKAVLAGESWRAWTLRTSYWPFANQLAGHAAWTSAWPGRTVVLAGLALWLVATWAHPEFGLPSAGIWRWLK